MTSSVQYKSPSKPGFFMALGSAEFTTAFGYQILRLHWNFTNTQMRWVIHLQCKQKIKQKI